MSGTLRQSGGRPPEPPATPGGTALPVDTPDPGGPEPPATPGGTALPVDTPDPGGQETPVRSREMSWQ